MTYSTPAPLTSAAHVATPRGERWVRQLASHLGHRAEVTADGDAQVVRLPTATCRMAWDDAGITLDATAEDEESLARVQHVVGSHLERFAAKDGVTVIWSAGS